MSDPALERKPVVLVVDDDAAVRLMVRVTLEEAGFDVVEAADGGSGLAAFAQYPPDLVLLDVILPDEDGLTVCEFMRHSPGGHELPIAIVTGLDDLSSISQAYQAGATDFITKPIAWATLPHRLRYILRATRAFNELSVSEGKMRALLSALPDIIFRVSHEGVVLEMQEGQRAALPPWMELTAGAALEDCLPAVPAGQIRRGIVGDGGCETRSVEFPIVAFKGIAYWEARIVPCAVEGASIVILRDITRRKNTESQLRLWARVFADSNDGILISDARNRIVSVNKAFERISGYEEGEILGQDPGLFGSGQYAPEFFAEVWRHITEQGYWQGEIWNRRKNGELYPSWVSISLMRNGKGEVENYIAIFNDITERKAAEAKIEYLAHHDSLTGLPNRTLLYDRLTMSIAQEERRGQSVALFFIDLDNFKHINDSLGHGMGDRVLCQVGERLRQVIRAEDTVGRLGGDEFIVIAPECSRDGVSALAEKVLQSLSHTYRLMDFELHLTTSIGIALFPDDGRDTDTLLRNADAAMYLAKANGRNNYQFYTEELNLRAQERLWFEHSLRRALARDEFVLYFQPQIDASSGALTGAEALIRWSDPDVGLIPPGKFIPMAEDLGMIHAIGDWVLRAACRQLALWQRNGLHALSMAVNISAQQFRDPGFLTRIAMIVRETGASPDKLELELTESVLMQDVAESLHTLRALKEMGFHLAIDDFGTGFSSLNYLRQFPVDMLKIDQSFVREMLRDGSTQAIVESIVSLAGALGKTTIAEGVETEEECTLLRAFHCDQLQGFLFSRPLPAGEFEDWVKQYRGTY